MIKRPSPAESGFATAEESETHDRWFRAKVQAALDDQRPTIPHEDVMSALKRIVDAKSANNASDPKAN